MNNLALSNVKRIKPDAHLMMTSIVDPDALLRAIDRFLGQQDVSFDTRMDYQARIIEFSLFLQFKGLHENTLLEYKKLLASDNTTKISTKNKRLTVARMFLRYLCRTGALTRDISVGVKNFRQSGLHKTSGLNKADIKKVRDWIHSDREITAKDIRIFTLIMLLAYHGLRQIEICRLQFEDIDFVKRFAMVQGKGQDDKEPVHLHKAVADMLKAYCSQFSIQSGPLFFSISNSSYGSPLTTRGLRQIVSVVLENLEIDKTVHGFRHYYVTQLVKAYRGDLFRVMRFTRHKTLSMLQTYNDEALHEDQYPIHDRIFNNVL